MLISLVIHNIKVFVRPNNIVLIFSVDNLFNNIKQSVCSFNYMKSCLHKMLTSNIVN